MGLVQSLSVETGGSMSLTWGQAIAGGLALTVVAGLLLLPGRLLGPDRPIELAIPPSKGTAWSVQAAPPRALPRPHAARPKLPSVSTMPRQTYASRAARSDARTVGRVTTSRPRVEPHRSAVINKLAP